jgi:hypothetical protein
MFVKRDSSDGTVFRRERFAFARFQPRADSASTASKSAANAHVIQASHFTQRLEDLS